MLKELSHEIESGHALVLMDRPYQAHVLSRFSDFLMAFIF
jgi:hypothetical protein